MNLHHQFYREYYRKLDPSQPSTKNRKELVDKYNQGRFDSINGRLTTKSVLRNIAPADYLFTHDRFGANLRQINLQTTYPGLICGTGYPHETGALGEFKIGFYFDQTTGLPTLPGSSIKGTLRNVFPRAEMLQQPSKEDRAVKREKARLVLHLLAKITHNERLVDWSHAEAIGSDAFEWVNHLEKQIFDGYDTNTGKRRSPNFIDVFLDAQISDGPGRDQPILGADYITPHGDNVWEEPTPLMFLKVLPQVSWEFSFLLHPTTIDGVEVSADHKRQLFRLLLLLTGVGAKTNVGYGRLIDPRSEKDDLFFLEEWTDKMLGSALVDNSENKESKTTEKDESTILIPDSTKIEAKYYRGNPKPGRSVTMEAVVIEAGAEMRVQVYFRKDAMPEVDLIKANPNLKKGDVVFVGVEMNKKKVIPTGRVIYEGLKK